MLLLYFNCHSIFSFNNIEIFILPLYLISIYLKIYFILFFSFFLFSNKITWNHITITSTVTIHPVHVTNNNHEIIIDFTESLVLISIDIQHLFYIYSHIVFIFSFPFLLSLFFVYGYLFFPKATSYVEKNPLKRWF